MWNDNDAARERAQRELRREIEELEHTLSARPDNKDTRVRYVSAYLRQLLRNKRDRLAVLDRQTRAQLGSSAGELADTSQNGA